MLHMLRPAAGACRSPRRLAPFAHGSLSPRADDHLLAITSTRSTPRPVSTTAPVSLHPHSRLIPAPPCLAAAALPSTSPASATAPALATSPTSSNGTSHNAISPERRRYRRRILVRPCPRLFCSSPACAFPMRAPPASLLSPALVRLPAAAATIFVAPSAPHRHQPSLTRFKVRSPCPLRHPRPALGFVSPVSILLPSSARPALTVQQLRLRRVREPSRC